MARPGLSTAERLSGYTDAVFAVIITIMVLELRPPESSEFKAILGLWPTIISYIVSYIFIAIIWINHHYLMTYVDVPSPRVIWLNFAHLFFVSLVPFATAWMADTKLARAPVITYALLFVATDGMYNLFEIEIFRHSAKISKTKYKTTRRRSLAALAFFVTAAVLATIESWLGFGLICLALALHLRPDASARWRRRKTEPTD